MTFKPRICVVGLGYVGLPLAYAFGKTDWPTFGYDISEKRISELQEGKDRTNELNAAQLRETKVTYSADPAIIAEANVIILALPTPVDEENEPDLTPVIAATETVGKYLKSGSIVVYESTVYPGVTEEICGPILEKQSGLKCGTDFKLAYSPERINPGDKEHTVEHIVKVVSGQDAETLDNVAEIYGRVIIAGVHRATSIKVAEMAKAIENAQRDLNIAYVNEIAMMCTAMGLRSKDVFDAARTKWNFLPFLPGLVGGHCIGVDPYYLIRKAKDLRMDLPMIISARRTNDGMAAYVCGQVVAALKSMGKKPKDCSILVLGLTFKENIPDMRNSKSGDVIRCLEKEGCTVSAHDSFAAPEKQLTQMQGMDAIVFLVPHKEYTSLKPGDFARIGKEKSCVFFDLKSFFAKQDMEREGLTYLAL